MEFYYSSSSETFVVLTADQFVGRDDGLLEQQRQYRFRCYRIMKLGDRQNTDRQSMDSPNRLPLKWTTPNNSILNEYYVVSCYTLLVLFWNH